MSGVVVWLTGLPASGKSTLAARLAERLRASGRPVAVLDGDVVRRALVPQPGYSPSERESFYATLGRLAALLARQGLAVLVPATAHLAAWRDEARRIAPRFVEVYVDVPADECRRRDPKGLWAQDLKSLPGAGVEYQPPPAPEVVASGGEDERAAEAVLRLL